MSLAISKSEGVTVFTVQSNRKSKWPIICQILGTMCYSPVCSVSQRLKQQGGCALTALATLQIMVGIMNLGFGSLTLGVYQISYLYSIPLWLGGVITAIGIMGVLAEKFPSPCLVALTVLMNIVSSAIGIASIALYSVDLSMTPYFGRCEYPERAGNGYYWTTASPAQNEIYEKKLIYYRACLENRVIMQDLLRVLDSMMIVLAVLHLCVTVSWSALNIKALCKKQAEAEDVEDPEVCKPLMKDEDVVC